MTTIKRISDQAYQSYIHRYQIEKHSQCTGYFKIINIPKNVYFHVGICDSFYLGKQGYVSQSSITYSCNGLLCERTNSSDINEKYTNNDLIAVRVNLREDMNIIEWFKNDKKVGESSITLKSSSINLYFVVITYH